MKKKKATQVYAIKRADGKLFKVGDKFTYPMEGTTIVLGKPRKTKMRISGFEQHENGWYVLYMPTYSDGVKEKTNAWRACDLESAILIK